MSSDLETFVAQYAKRYDQETDDYRRPPFASPIKAGKNSPVYKAHSYHTKVPPEGIIPYLEWYTEPGDLVLDPFCGSGMTGVACLLKNRVSILNDLSPAAIHIARNYTTPLDISDLMSEFQKIKIVIKEEFEWLYGTICDRCGGKATIIYTVWSDVFECSRCGNPIVMWDTAIDSNGKVKKRFNCKNCGKEHTKLGLERLPEEPVITNYLCKICKPNRAQHPTTNAEKRNIEQIEKASIPYWIPSTQFDTHGPQYRRNALSSRNIINVTDLYTKRNLWAFARLWHESTKVSAERISGALRFALTAINNYVNRKQSYGGGGGGLSGMIYIPSFVMEKNVLDVFERKINSICNDDYWLQIPPNYSYPITGSATDLQVVPTNSIDYIFTDPPFGSNIYYSEVNLLIEAWIGKFTDEQLEAVVHRKQDGGNKRISDYSYLISKSFAEMYRILKPGRWASVVFHNSDDRIWQAILDASENVGFEIAEINAFDKVQLTFKGAKGAKGEERVTNKDIVLNLRRPHSKDKTRLNGRSQEAEAEKRMIEAVADFLLTNPSPENRTLQQIWNHALYDMLRNGSVQVSMANLEEILAYHYHTFKIVDGRYYLRGESVVGGNIYNLDSDAGAIAWLNMILANDSQTTGDLIPKWQQETAHIESMDSGRLDRLLEQNFWKDNRKGCWRIPTLVEREKMSARADLGAQAHLRVIHCYLEGELDYRPDDRELAAWIRFCYNREFYPEIIQLFHNINENSINQEEYKTIRKMAQVAKIKIG